MTQHPAPVEREALSNQQRQWDSNFESKPEMFGETSSEAARMAAETLKKAGAVNLLELGGGQGRDTIFLAQRGFRVHVLDYSEPGIEAIRQKVQTIDPALPVTATCFDIRKPLPFEDEMFDGCYSHMLHCMALTSRELEFLSGEIRRVLKPGGLNIYTVRHTGDAHYGTGIHRGEDMYEVGGFIVHFFSKAKIERLARGYEVVSIDEFEEGGLPRKLFRVTLRKRPFSQ